METKGGPAFNLYISSLIGIEDIVKEELRFFLKDKEIKVNPYEFRGKILVKDLTPSEIADIFLKLRTPERIGIFLGSFELGINKLKDFLFSLNLKDFYEKGLKFRIKCKKRNNKIKLSKMEIESLLGSYFIEKIKNELNTTPPVDLENPDFILRCDISERFITFWIDLTGNKAMHIRKYRVFNHPAPLKGTVASALILKMNLKNEKIFLDPMTGGGTIPIECALYSQGKSPHILRKDEFLIWKIKPFKEFNPDEFLKEKGIKKNLKILGSDISLEFLKGAKENAKRASVSEFINFINMDARTLSKVFKEVDYILLNPPYGLRMRVKEEERGVMKEFFREAEKILSPKGKIGIITARMDLVRKYRGDFKIIWRRKIFHGDIRIFGFILTR